METGAGPRKRVWCCSARPSGPRARTIPALRGIGGSGRLTDQMPHAVRVHDNGSGVVDLIQVDEVIRRFGGSPAVGELARAGPDRPAGPLRIVAHRPRPGWPLRNTGLARDPA